MKEFSHKYVGKLKEILDNFPYEQFERLIQAMMGAYRNGRNIFIMGNGGSASTASHWACDINKGCSNSANPRFRMICLNDSVPTMLAYANDQSYEDIFIEQLRNFFTPQDIVIGISVSGNSRNVLKAIAYARKNGGITVGLCGFEGGELCGSVDIPILIKAADLHKAEDVHLIVAHMSMEAIQKILKDR